MKWKTDWRSAGCRERYGELRCGKRDRALRRNPAPGCRHQVGRAPARTGFRRHRAAKESRAVRGAFIPCGCRTGAIPGHTRSHTCRATCPCLRRGCQAWCRACACGCIGNASRRIVQGGCRGHAHRYADAGCSGGSCAKVCRPTCAGSPFPPAAAAVVAITGRRVVRPKTRSAGFRGSRAPGTPGAPGAGRRPAEQVGGHGA